MEAFKASAIVFLVTRKFYQNSSSPFFSSFFPRSQSNAVKIRHSCCLHNPLSICFIVVTAIFIVCLATIPLQIAMIVIGKLPFINSVTYFTTPNNNE